MRTYPSIDTMKNEKENALRCSMDILNTFSHRSALTYHIVPLKKEYIVIHLRNLEPKAGHVNGRRYIAESVTKTFFSCKLRPPWAMVTNWLYLGSFMDLATTPSVYQGSTVCSFLFTCAL